MQLFESPAIICLCDIVSKGCFICCCSGSEDTFFGVPSGMSDTLFDGIAAPTGGHSSSSLLLLGLVVLLIVMVVMG